MFSEIVKLTPQLDRAAMNNMFRTLSSRFTEVAKKFGNGLKMAMKLAPFMAIAGAILTKILNPLQKAEEIIDKILGRAGDLTDTAEELGADVGAYARLESVAQAKGVDAATLRTLIGKFQSDLAKERENQRQEEADRAAGKTPTTQPGLLREFTSETDTAQAFFTFIQSMQKLTKDQQTLVQDTIFGERLRGRVAAFFNEQDFAKILNRLPSRDSLRSAIQRADAIGDTRDIDTAAREAEDLVTKSNLMQTRFVKALDQSARLQDQSDNEQLKRFDSLKSTSIAVQELTHKFDSFTTQLINDTAPMLIKLLNELAEGVKILIPIMQKIGEWTATAFDSTIEAIANMSVAIEGYWNEFKNSRVFKWFGRN